MELSDIRKKMQSVFRDLTKEHHHSRVVPTPKHGATNEEVLVCWSAVSAASSADALAQDDFDRDMPNPKSPVRLSWVCVTGCSRSVSKPGSSPTSACRWLCWRRASSRTCPMMTGAAMRRPFLDLVTGEVFLDLESLRLAQPGAFIVPVSWDDPDLNPADPATWAGYMEKHHVL